MSDFSVRRGEVHDMCLVRPTAVADHRGHNVRTFDTQVHAPLGVDPGSLEQELQTTSHRGVLRGLHGRRDLAETKLVRVVHGRVWDVCVDIRPWSPTFLQWQAVLLDDEGHLQVLIPPGCLHGYQVLTATATVLYRLNAAWAPEKSLAIRHDDPEFDLPWPLPDPTLSDRDRDAVFLADVRDQLDDWFATLAPDVASTTSTARSQG